MATQITKASSNSVLQSWLKHQGITPAEFSRELGYKNPKSVYDMVGPRPRTPVNDAVLGRIVRVYKTKAIDLAIALAETMS
mgnify:FL=1